MSELVEQTLDEARLTLATPPTSWWRVLFTPWTGLLRPGTAGARLAAAPAGAFALLTMLMACTVTAAIVLLVLWDETERIQVGPPQPAATQSNTAPQTLPDRQIQVRSMAEVWREGHAGRTVTELELMMIVLPPAALIVAAVGAWLLLLEVHVAGSVLRSYGRTYRALVAGSGALLLMTIGVGALAVFVNHTLQRGSTGQFGGVDLVPLVVASIAVGIQVVIVYAHLAVRGAARASEEAGPAAAPICEGCGYDLTHQPETGRCPECGSSVAASLSASGRRTNAWENTASFNNWISTTVDVLFRPRLFYQRLAVCPAGRGLARFAVWHYCLLGLLAPIWMMCAVSARSGWDDGMADMAVIMMTWVPLAAWGVHRFAAALAATGGLARQDLPDFSRFRRVGQYEAAFLWTFAAFDAALITSYVGFDFWISRLIGRGVFMSTIGAPPEVVLLLGGNIVLLVVWLLRFRIAVVSIRWSNF